MKAALFGALAWTYVSALDFEWGSFVDYGYDFSGDQQLNGWRMFTGKALDSFYIHQREACFEFALPNTLFFQRLHLRRGNARKPGRMPGVLRGDCGLQLRGLQPIQQRLPGQARGPNQIHKDRVQGPE